MQNAIFSIVAFEGTDSYSQAGGLGVRVSGLARTLAELRHETHLFFIGDPNGPGEERVLDGYLTLHRWAQWISVNCPGGVYDGEEAKVADLTESLPGYLIDRVIRPAVAAGRIAVVMLEEWQTAECACRLADMLEAEGIRDRVVIFWTANNSYGFHRIDWHRLASRVTIATISRYMRSIIRSHGVDAQVIPNGIPAELLEPMPRGEASAIRRVKKVGRRRWAPSPSCASAGDIRCSSRGAADRRPAPRESSRRRRRADCAPWKSPTSAS